MIVYPTTAKTTNGAFPETAGKLVDDWLRRELRVGDPKDPGEVSKALLTKYKPEAIKLEEESRGLSVPLAGPVWQLEDAPAAGVEAAPSRELARVQDDVAYTARALVSDPATREWIPEMSGWEQTVVRELSDGADAARYSPDAAQRERAFLAVRRLGDYARVARFVGTRHPDVRAPYRRFATALDDGCWVLRILMGEALYNAGLIDGGFILQVPVVDARQRRDALLASLRALLGATDDVAASDWGRGPASYGGLLRMLEQACEPELRVYLRESTLAQSIDNLLAAAGRRDPQALRSLAATAPVELLQLERLLATAVNLNPPQSSPLSAFVQTLALFLDAFTRGRAGARLIDLAVPLPLAARQTFAPDGAIRGLLRDLIGWRADVAREIECFSSCCDCDRDTHEAQVVLDAALSMVDRAVDLLALGVEPNGDVPEWRAAATVALALNYANAPGVLNYPTPALLQLAVDPRPMNLVNAFPAANVNAQIPDVQQELARREAEFDNLVVTLAPRCQMDD